MTPCDFKLFPKSLNEQKILKGKCFESREEITWNPPEELYIIPVPAFQRSYQQWHGPENFHTCSERVLSGIMFVRTLPMGHLTYLSVIYFALVLVCCI